ncbi:hypothetical protein [Bradyrhizobium elkanii]|uniref:hypothetical protein n=1 Tax=Bradyrhizobium elkanii TaxID=29448 RepID=UPI003D199597
MSEILADVIAGYGREVDAESLAKTRAYLETLLSVGKRDDLTVFGIAYLDQLHNPDRRYSGC